MGYSNESNPFGDSNLTDKFVWHKKLNATSQTSTPRSKSGHDSRKKSVNNDADDRREELVREVRMSRNFLGLTKIIDHESETAPGRKRRRTARARETKKRRDETEGRLPI